MKKKEHYKSIIIGILFFIGILSYFSLEWVSFQTLLFFSLIIFSFYFFDRITSAHFKKEHYLYVSFISLSFLFFYYMQLYFLYVDKVLHLLGGIMLCSVIYQFMNKIHISRKKKYLVTFFLSMLVILGYEVYEFMSDQLFNTQMQGVYTVVKNETVIVIGKIADTASDIVIGLTGVVMYLLNSLLHPIRTEQ